MGYRLGLELLEKVLGSRVVNGLVGVRRGDRSYQSVQPGGLEVSLDYDDIERKMRDGEAFVPVQSIGDLEAGKIVIKYNESMYQIEKVGEHGNCEMLDELAQDMSHGRAPYGFRAVNEGHIVAERGGKSRFVIDRQDKRCWVEEEMHDLYILTDDKLIGKVNAVYDGVRKRYKETGRKDCLRLVG